MKSLEKRVSKLESIRPPLDLTTMSDEELMAHADTLPAGSTEQIKAVLTKILRHGSTLPIVYEDFTSQSKTQRDEP